MGITASANVKILTASEYKVWLGMNTDPDSRFSSTFDKIQGLSHTSFSSRFDYYELGRLCDEAINGFKYWEVPNDRFTGQGRGIWGWSYYNHYLGGEEDN